MRGKIENAKIIKVPDGKTFNKIFFELLDKKYVLLGIEDTVVDEKFKEEFRREGGYILTTEYEIYYARDLIALEKPSEVKVYKRIYIFALPPAKAFMYKRETFKNRIDKLVKLRIRVVFDSDWIEEVELEGEKLRDFIISDPIIHPEFFKNAEKKAKLLRSRRQNT